MSFEEKSTWVSLSVSVIVGGVYALFILGQLQAAQAVEIAYQRPMLFSIGAMIIVSIAGNILMAVGSAVSATIKGDGSVDHIDRKDERDDTISRRGELFGYYVSSAGMLGALALAMLRADHFWIANAIYLALMAGGLSSAVAKLVVYRRGF